jgi:hypothetical protein
MYDSLATISEEETVQVRKQEPKKTNVKNAPQHWKQQIEACNAIWKKQRNMKKATQHGKSAATWKKHRNMEQAPQHGTSAATWNKRHNNMQKAPQHEIGKATSKPKIKTNTKTEHTIKTSAKKRRSNTKDKTKITSKIVIKNNKNGPPRWGRQRNARQQKHTTRCTPHTNISPTYQQS